MMVGWSGGVPKGLVCDGPVLKEASGRVPGGFREGFGTIFKRFWEDFRAFLEAFGGLNND